MKSRKIIVIAASFIIAVVISVLLIYNFQDNAPDTKLADNIIPARMPNEFGLYTDSLRESEHIVKRNETFGAILFRYNISQETFLKIQKASQNIFNIREIIAGNKYYTFTSADTSNHLRFLIYEKDPVNFTVFDINDSIKVFNGARTVEYKTKTVAGEINYSLYNSLSEKDADPELIYKLAKVYAWQIDFFRLRKGDSYKVIYEEKYVAEEPIGINKIIAADFKHDDQNFYAIRFKQDSVSEFFDEDGNSLMKAFLKAPLEYSRISSRYSKKRFHPILKRFRPHLGIDYAAPTGTPIHSVGDGIVIEAAYSSGNGRFVKIRHNSVYSTQYLHMSMIAKGIRTGVSVKQGETIGYVGSTGLATGPHLCFRLWKYGAQVNPLKEKIPPSHPVNEDNLNAFNKKKESILKELKEIQLPSEDNTPT
ncbi:MAG: peptidoglycan DD-metalloendopeptidase family protein [Ignavibacteriaceae bacterium]